MKESRLFQIAQQLGLDPTISLDQVDLSLICAKCQRVANSVSTVKRRNKSGLFYYKQWRHLDRRKKGGYLYHYGRFFPDRELLIERA